ncbi:MAG: PAS domain-containing protein [Gemmatimonadaceae bacterium]
MGTATPRARLDSISLRALEFCPDAIVVTMGVLEPTGPTIIFVNKAFERLTGYRRNEAWGLTPKLLLGPGDTTTAPDPLLEALRAGEDFHGELEHQRKDGTSYRADWRVSPMRDPRGAISHWIGVHREVRGCSCPPNGAPAAGGEASERRESVATPGAARRGALTVSTLRIEQVTVEPAPPLAGTAFLA